MNSFKPNFQHYIPQCDTSECNVPQGFFHKQKTIRKEVCNVSATMVPQGTLAMFCKK